MLHQHFGLSGPAFHYTPPPEALYLSADHREALALLEWGMLHEATGFTLLVGESGTGKSTLVSALLKLRPEKVFVACISNPKLSFEQLMQLMLSQLDMRPTAHGKLELLRQFSALLGGLGRDEHVAVIIDEAQELSDEVLDDLRLLSNMEGNQERRLRFVLIGQPDLMEQLAKPELRALDQRIGARAILKPLAPKQARAYIECRLRSQGARANRIFAAAALDHLIDHSGGIARRINVLCNNAMLIAYGAGRRRVSLGMAKTATGEYEMFLSAHSALNGNGPRALASRPRHGSGLALAITTLLLAMVGAAVWSTPGRMLLSAIHTYGSHAVSRLSSDRAASEPSGVLGGILSERVRGLGNRVSDLGVERVIGGSDRLRASIARDGDLQVIK